MKSAFASNTDNYKRGGEQRVNDGSISEDSPEILQDDMVFRLNPSAFSDNRDAIDAPMWSSESLMQMGWLLAEE